MAEAVRPGPAIHPENEAFWDSLKEHQLRLQFCSDCGTPRFPVSPVCFKCLSYAAEWKPVSGRGRVVSAITIHRATGNAFWSTRTPFAVGIVQLQEGPQMTVGLGDNDLKAGSPVQARFVDEGDVTYLEFAPI
jgi:uncharacterized protein